VGGGGAITVNDTTGEGAVSLMSTADRSGSISVGNYQGKNPMELLHTDDGDGMIVLNNHEGTQTVGLGNGIIELDNAHQKKVVYLGMTEDGYLVLYDRYGEGQWSETGKRK